MFVGFGRGFGRGFEFAVETRGPSLHVMRNARLVRVCWKTREVFLLLSITHVRKAGSKCTVLVP